jgi:hypothetical protein
VEKIAPPAVRTAEAVEHDETVLKLRFTYPVEKMHPP